MKREYIVSIDYIRDTPPGNKEIVRCKNCKHYDGDGTCLKIGIAMLTDDWFCADGERRELMVRIDMPVPDMCHDCRLYCNDDGLSLCMAISKEGKWIDDDDAYIRQSWCPLKEIVQCKDCKYYRPHRLFECEKRGSCQPNPEWFCADGERKENE